MTEEHPEILATIQRCWSTMRDFADGSDAFRAAHIEMTVALNKLADAPDVPAPPAPEPRSTRRAGRCQLRRLQGAFVEALPRLKRPAKRNPVARALRVNRPANTLLQRAESRRDGPALTLARGRVDLSADQRAIAAGLLLARRCRDPCSAGERWRGSGQGAEF
jgi:hypothetical protein